MKRFKNILFVMDSELKGGDAFERAVSLAESNQARLTIVSIVDELPVQDNEKFQDISILEIQDSIISKHTMQLKNMLSSIETKINISSKVLTGVDFLVLVQEVLKQNIDLLIKTADEEGIINRIFTSSDMHLLRKCPCPVWLIKASRKGHYKKIMAAVDFDPFNIKAEDEALNQQIIEMSGTLALSDFSELHIIHVWDAYGESSLRSGLAYQPEAYVNAYVERIRVKHHNLLTKLSADFVAKGGKEVFDYLKPKIHLVKGCAQDMIAETVKEQEIDLIIMGTVGRTGIPGFIMGNTAETILNRIDCSVLAIKPDGFVTPVRLVE